MESVQSSDELCAHAAVACSSSTCSLSALQGDLDEHLLLRHSVLSSAPSGPNQECPKGCGLLLTTKEDKEHNCITKLRTTIEVLRTEMMCRMEDQKREMEAMFDIQRGQMLKKETALQGQIEALKTELGRLGDRLKTLLDVEMNRQQELDRLTSERAEIMALLTELQNEKQNAVTLCQNCSLGNKGKVTNV
ncbi:hypothetical protein BsWGS_15571 [Bradybaena similaris]